MRKNERKEGGWEREGEERERGLWKDQTLIAVSLAAI